MLIGQLAVPGEQEGEHGEQEGVGRQLGHSSVLREAAPHAVDEPIGVVGAGLTEPGGEQSLNVLVEQGRDGEPGKLCEQSRGVVAHDAAGRQNRDLCIGGIGKKVVDLVVHASL